MYHDKNFYKKNKKTYVNKLSIVVFIELDSSLLHVMTVEITV